MPNQTKTAHWTAPLDELGACADALKWAKTQPDAATAWRACPRGDWMLWLLGKLAGGPSRAARRPLVLACCACARLALSCVPAGEGRPLLAIATAERWARGAAGVCLEDVRSAAYAADAAADAADVAAHAAYAAYAAADAADTEGAADAEGAAAVAAAHAAYAAYTAAVAAYAADAAGVAAAVAAYAAARAAQEATLRQCADIVRQHYPEPPAIA